VTITLILCGGNITYTLFQIGLPSATLDVTQTLSTAADIQTFETALAATDASIYTTKTGIPESFTTLPTSSFAIKTLTTTTSTSSATCYAKYGMVVTDDWCKTNCKDRDHPACQYISGVDQKCICDDSPSGTSDGWINGFCNDTRATIKKKLREELMTEMVNFEGDCGKPECLDRCKKYDWFACEYHQDSHNCVAVIGPVDPENTIIPPLNEKQGFCYLNRDKIPFN